MKLSLTRNVAPGPNQPDVRGLAMDRLHASVHKAAVDNAASTYTKLAQLQQDLLHRATVTMSELIQESWPSAVILSLSLLLMGFETSRMIWLDHYAMRWAATIGESVYTRSYYRQKMIPARNSGRHSMVQLLGLTGRKDLWDHVDALLTTCNLIPPALNPAVAPTVQLDDTLDSWCPHSAEFRGVGLLTRMLRACIGLENLPGGSAQHAVLCALALSIRPWCLEGRVNQTFDELEAISLTNHALNMHREDADIFKRALCYHLKRCGLHADLCNFIYAPFSAHAHSL